MQQEHKEICTLVTCNGFSWPISNILVQRITNCALGNNSITEFLILGNLLGRPLQLQ